MNNKLALKFAYFFSISFSVFLLSNPDFAAFFEQANENFKQGNYEKAQQLYFKTIELNAECHQAFFNCGLVYSQREKHQEALTMFLKALTLNPNHYKAKLYAGISYRHLQKYEESLNYLLPLLEQTPQDYDILINIARAYSEKNNFEQAINYFNKALAINSQDASLQLELANTLNMFNETEKALQIYFDLLKKLPNDASIIYNIAYTLKKLGKIDQALPFYEKVLSLDPLHEEAHFSLSLAYLITGDFEKGWAEYEWRWKRHHHHRNLSKPQWMGEDVHGKTIFLHAEQGLGDTFQFIRYAQFLKNMGATVVVAVQDPLKTIIELCPYIDRVITLSQPVANYDYHCPLVSLPNVFKTRLETIPTNIPYLFADKNLTEHWKTTLSNDKNFKVGICWQGNPNYTTHFLRSAVAAKSITLKKLKPLFDVNGITVYNLQRITGTEQLRTIDTTITLITFNENFDTTHGRFMDTAAVLLNLDLFITVDTSMAHLAGGLGIPVWVMLPDPGDWRWLLHRTDSPWYPTMRLFRQQKSGDWESVISEIAQELTKLIAQKSGSMR